MLDASLTRSKVLTTQDDPFGWTPPDPGAKVVGFSINPASPFAVGFYRDRSDGYRVTAAVKMPGEDVPLKVEVVMKPGQLLADRLRDALDAAYREKIG